MVAAPSIHNAVLSHPLDSIPSVLLPEPVLVLQDKARLRCLATELRLGCLQHSRVTLQYVSLNLLWPF